jgi:hypothetical protein
LDRFRRWVYSFIEMNDFDEPTYKLPPDLLRAAQEADETIRQAIQSVEGRYLVRRQIEVLRIQDEHGTASVSASELLQFLSPLTRSISHDSADGKPIPHRSMSLSGVVGNNILRFAEQFADQLRTVICKGKKDALSTTSYSAIAALATWLASHSGIEPHLATAVATAILIAVLTATKGAFCKMTAREAKEAFAKIAKPKRS